MVNIVIRATINKESISIKEGIFFLLLNDANFIKKKKNCIIGKENILRAAMANQERQNSK